MSKFATWLSQSLEASDDITNATNTFMWYYEEMQKQQQRSETGPDLDLDGDDFSDGMEWSYLMCCCGVQHMH
jgi:hypothetical protein